MGSFLTLILMIASIALGQLQVNIDTIVFDIIQLDNAVQKLTTSTQAYTGGLLLSQGIDFAVVEGKLTRANTDISLLPPDDLTVPEIQYLENVVSQTLAIDNPKAVNVLISKKDLIEQTPLQGGLVKTGLSSLLAGHLYFSKQTLDRTPASETANVQKLVDVITVALQKGIDAFTVLNQWDFDLAESVVDNANAGQHAQLRDSTWRLYNQSNFPLFQ